jgi:hypothetical protein
MYISTTQMSMLLGILLSAPTGLSIATAFLQASHSFALT